MKRIGDPVKTKPLTRTLAGLREALFDELDRLRSGESDYRRAAATAALAKGILDATSIQLQYEKAWGEKKIGNKLKSIELTDTGHLIGVDKVA